MYQLYYCPGHGSLAPRILLEEIGVPYNIELVDIKQNQQKSDAYTRLNPNGRIPTLVDDNLVIFESAAICMHLADKHPEGCLAPAIGDKARAHFYQWLIYLTNTIQPEIIIYYDPKNHVDKEECIDSLKQKAEEKAGKMFQIIDNALSVNSYILGQQFSACDIYLLMLCRWCRIFKSPPSKLPNLKRCLDLVVARPAVQKVFSNEGIEEPFY